MIIQFLRPTFPPASNYFHLIIVLAHVMGGLKVGPSILPTKNGALHQAGLLHRQLTPT
ncbi:hypothetical protein BGZ61DRAFT_447832 [Ilyonectria robusta]|uniref:uncharacterized protein n=1 Tax=Ilyonectria robusta TaxID=1079257 RepID=UPI001E8E5664|nr:uncharacterized protein BGZ61DRAFT_447832 [Ilyonectria robusta]KAH8722010.1 hypothetical protein BGZ61DRAFT_447832 [Ilyonectria robusta]